MKVDLSFLRMMFRESISLYFVIARSVFRVKKAMMK